MPAFEAVLWCLLVLVIAAFDVVHVHGPQLYNDSYQYLSIAANLRDHHSCSTSIIHFDAERAHGRLPAPETTFPPGYPVAIWALSWIGLPLEEAALLVSALAGAATAILLWLAAELLCFPIAVTRLCLLLLALNSAAGLFWTSVASESLFTAVSFGALVLLLWGERRHNGYSGKWAPVAGFTLVGIAYWIRYAGLLIVGAVLLYALVRAVQDRARRLVWIGAVVCLCMIVLAGMLRNVFIAGAWQGGHIKALHNPVPSILRIFVIALYQLLLGPTWTKSNVGSAFSIGSASAVMFGVALLAISILWSRSGWRMTGIRVGQPAVLLLLLWLSVYCVGMVYLGVVTPITFGMRMFVPMIPVALLLAGLVFASRQQAPMKTLSAVASCMFVLGYATANVASMRADIPAFEHQRVSDALAQPMQNGEELSRWIDDNIPRGAVLLADDGQATAYLLKRNTVSLVEAQFSDVNWNEPQTRAVMRKFAADYLILYPGLPARSIPAEVESDFLHRLDSGDTAAWLELAAQNSSVRIFRRRDGMPRTYISKGRH